jgi:DNA segregation ATPase FtsK/SpoIIIE-like protein
MHSLNPDFILPELRRLLEEILVIVKSDQIGSVKNPDQTYAGVAEPDVSQCETMLVEYDQPDARDALYDDALVVVTEFGQASPAILQMWLSIDYARALRIMNRLQADGLVSGKGRVRHKAYSLRRSEQQGSNATM